MIAVDDVATWRVRVTEADLGEARAAWLRARDAGAPPDRVLDLFEELERMTRTATLQAMGDGGAGGGTGGVPTTGDRGARLRVPAPGVRVPGVRRVTASRLSATG